MLLVTPLAGNKQLNSSRLIGLTRHLAHSHGFLPALLYVYRQVHLNTIPHTMLTTPSVADPGFPVGGLAPVRGMWTSDAGAFR